MSPRCLPGIISSGNLDAAEELVRTTRERLELAIDDIIGLDFGDEG